MNEQKSAPREFNLEYTPKTKRLPLLLGGAALIMTGIWSTYKYKSSFSSYTTNFLEKVNVIEKEEHSQIITMLNALAASHNVSPDTSDHAYWSNILTVSRAIDDFVDEGQPDTIDQEALSLICGNATMGISHKDAQIFSTLLHEAPSERRDIILDGLQVTKFADTLKKTTDINDLFKLRDEEALIYTQIMTLDNPNKDQQKTLFNKNILALGKLAYELDTVFDLRKDYQDTTTQVRPTLAAYFTATKKALTTSYETLQNTPNSALPRIGLMGVQKMARGALRSISARSV